MIIGTAGHVDHGKTTLIKALTGIDTDRLKEEKARGLSIELGFAHFDLPSGRRAGIVDVPGHERFVHHMLAGAGGMDLVVLVIAADEGVMPQTVEHLQILQLLDVRQGLVALTKIDMVEPGWLEMVTDDIRARLAGTFLADAPIVPASGVTGEGLDALIAAIDTAAEQVRERDSTLPMRLPIDRVFTRPGFGTVVTGTQAAGTLRVGDQVTIMPRGLDSRVRNLQIHGEAVEVTQAGHRVAVNLTGMEVAQIERGDVLSHPGTFQPTSMLDVRIHMLADASAPLRHASRIRVHLGAVELLARVMLLESERLAPAASGLGQIRLESPTIAARGDRLVIRSYSPAHTIAGAIVLNPYPAKHRRRDRDLVAALALAESASQDEIVESAALDDPAIAIDRRDVARRLGLSPAELDQRIARLVAAERLVRLDPEGFVLHADRHQALRHQIVARIEAFHQDHPLVAGIPQEDLRAMLPDRPTARLLQRVVADLIAEGRLAREGERVRLAEFGVRLTSEQEQIAEQIESIFRDAPFSSPALSDVINRFGDAAQARSVARVLLDRGRLVQIGDIILHHTAVDRARSIVLDHLAKNPTITAAQFRTLIGSSRKYAVPILEHFDRLGITRRLGDERVAGPKANASF